MTNDTPDSDKQEEAPQKAQESDSSDNKEQAIQDLTETLQRLQAEFENSQKRNQQQMRSCIDMAAKDIMVKLLPTLDDFERAIQHVDASAEKAMEGFLHIYENLRETLSQEGLTKIQAEGQQFDPRLHEALMVEKTDDKKRDNTVIEVFQNGYMLKDNVIRHAKVKVARKSD
ncbi:MAG: nucleotide exchange factor GrpE [Nanoarchaeota archaeon]